MTQTLAKLRAEELHAANMRALHVQTDRLFAGLLVLQWVAAVVVAVATTPATWAGAASSIHPHVIAAVVIGAFLALPPALMALRWPGAVPSRVAIAIAQMLFSGLFIQLSGGRIETHFHIFGSLAIIAFYRDWRLFIPATIVVASDHITRGMLWPQSVFGSAEASPWRALEHGGWVLFENLFLGYSCIRGVREMREFASSRAILEFVINDTENLVRDRTAALERTRHEIQIERGLLSNIVANIPFMVFWKGRDGRFLGCNDAFARLVHLAPGQEIVGLTDFDIHPDPKTAEAYRADDSRVLASGRAKLLYEENLVHSDGQQRHLLTSKVPLLDDNGEVYAVLGICADITDQKRLEMQLAQAQKLESIGQLAAGIAHEINTPVQYVGDNVRFVRDQFAGLMRLLQRYAGHLEGNAPVQSWAERRADIAALAREIDFDFVVAEVPLALEQSLEGIGRVSAIVSAMKNFSHPGSAEREPADLNRAIISTATVCTNRWKYVADLKFALEDSLPPVPCLLAEFNQVVLNLIVNAADAISERVGAGGEKGEILLTTRRARGGIEFTVRDNGAGIPLAVRARIFDPFFTTKPVGKGTGQGLPISRNVIVAKHGGTLTFETELGQGTTFAVWLPIPAEQGEADSESIAAPSAGPAGDSMPLESPACRQAA
ncbi:hypothetical protein BH11PLA1_BH11PLA1_16740 [soil metagenome]